eukprot:5101087-Amphidinium_carterae.1
MGCHRSLWRPRPETCHCANCCWKNTRMQMPAAQQMARVHCIGPRTCAMLKFWSSSWLSTPTLACRINEALMP